MSLQHLSKKIFVISLMALALNSLKIEQVHAIKIPITVTEIQNQVTPDSPKKHSAYNKVNWIIVSHHSTDLVFALFTLDCGLGAVALVPSLIAEGTNTTPWGHELHRAKKLKKLVIASSKSYASHGDPYVFSDKSLVERKRKSESSEAVFTKFYSQLQKSYPHKKAPSKEEIKELLYRANKTGLLASNKLLRKMLFNDSFSPLISIIVTGQLLDRIEKVETIIQARDNKMAEITENISYSKDTKNLLLAHSSSLESHPIVIALHKALQGEIEAINPFIFSDSKEKNMGYELID